MSRGCLAGQHSVDWGAMEGSTGGGKTQPDFSLKGSVKDGSQGSQQRLEIVGGEGLQQSHLEGRKTDPDLKPKQGARAG